MLTNAIIWLCRFVVKRKGMQKNEHFIKKRRSIDVQKKQQPENTVTTLYCEYYSNYKHVGMKKKEKVQWKKDSRIIIKFLSAFLECLCAVNSIVLCCCNVEFHFYSHFPLFHPSSATLIANIDCRCRFLWPFPVLNAPRNWSTFRENCFILLLLSLLVSFFLLLFAAHCLSYDHGL